MKLENRQPCEKGGCTSIDDQTHELNQEPITRSFHLPYKPLELTLSRENLFIEIAFAEYFSHLLSNIQSEQSYDYTSDNESQTRDLKLLPTMAVARVEDLWDKKSAESLVAKRKR